MQSGSTLVMETLDLKSGGSDRCQSLSVSKVVRRDADGIEPSCYHPIDLNILCCVES